MTVPIASIMPKTLTKRIQLDEVLKVLATLDEYFAFLPKCEYRLDYSDGNILSMGFASILHEALVARIGHLFYTIFGIDSEYHILASNVATYFSDSQSVYHPDVVVLKGKPQHYIHQGKKKKIKALLNPHIIVEVLSRTTSRYDLGVKLPRYKTLPSVQHILFIGQHNKAVSLYSRTNRPGQWLNIEEQDAENGFVTINRKKLRLADIYRNTVVE